MLLNTFIFSSLHVSGTNTPIIRRNYRIYATLLFVTLFCLLAGMNFSQQTEQPPIQNDKYQCRIDTVSSPDDGRIDARNMYRRGNKYIKKYVYQVGLICKRIS